MSRLQEAVNRFAASWLADHGEKPSQDLISDGTFSKQTGENFCLCFRPLARMIDLTGLTCKLCGKPYTRDSNAWFDEARIERAQQLHADP